VGPDINTGAIRFGFGIDGLADGIGFVPLAMGIFGIAEVHRGLAGHWPRR
jgi:TctA family transporter